MIKTRGCLVFLMGCFYIITSCTQIRATLYDDQKRKTVRADAYKSYANSPAGKAAILKNSLLKTAQQYLGSPYRYGGMDPKKGFDCSGFVWTVANENSIRLPRSSDMMGKTAAPLPWHKATPGDLVFFGHKNRIDHVGFVEKNIASSLIVIHSTTRNGVIRENVLASPYWKKRILHAVDISNLP
jgi:cell wall-associated NlpC family hydrolase